MSLPPKSYLDLFHSLSADLKGLKTEITKYRLAQQEATVGSLTALQAEQLRHAATRSELEAQINQLQLENTILSLQAESTASTLRAEIRALQTRHDHELVALNAILKLRIYEFGTYSSDNPKEDLHELSRIESAISNLRNKAYNSDDNANNSRKEIDNLDSLELPGKDEL